MASVLKRTTVALCYLTGIVVAGWFSIYTGMFGFFAAQWQPCYDHHSLWILHGGSVRITELSAFVNDVEVVHREVRRPNEAIVLLPSPMPTGALSFEMTMQDGSVRRFENIATLSNIADPPRIWVLTSDGLIRLTKLVGDIRCGVISSWFGDDRKNSFLEGALEYFFNTKSL